MSINGNVERRRARGSSTLAWATKAFVAGVVLVSLFNGETAQAATAASYPLANLASVAPATSCGSLTGTNFSGVIADGTVTISSAVPATTSANSSVPVGTCVVTGLISPAINFKVWLPPTWTQRYVQIGCGGLCGMISNPPPSVAISCIPVTSGQTVLAATDMGSAGRFANSPFYAGDNPSAAPQNTIDFGYRAQHETSLVAKALIAQFYGQAPKYSYFDGCSDGGREALMEAQRYPNDFDGILAGAPANNLDIQNTIHHAWNIRANLDASSRYILLAAKLSFLHQQVLNACDAMDGVTDGVIDDPRRCTFNPQTLVDANCTQTTNTCLTAAEAIVVQNLHDGATDGNGNRLEQYISHEWGSELDWSLFIPATAAGPGGSAMFVNGYYPYLALKNQQNPSLNVYNMPLTVAFVNSMLSPSSPTYSHPYLDATDSDLSAFNAHNGKLVLYHGWGDQHITPQGTLEYWQAVRDTMGASTAEQFVKLYLFPGMAHCGGGNGPNTFDLLTPVMSWVETATKPSTIVASNSTTGTSRPVFPYPLVAHYTGSGDTKSAANFNAYVPMTQAPANYNWVGNSIYSNTNYEQTCTIQNGQLVCRPGR